MTHHVTISNIFMVAMTLYVVLIHLKVLRRHDIVTSPWRTMGVPTMPMMQIKSVVLPWHWMSCYDVTMENKGCYIVGNKYNAITPQ